LCHDTEEAYLLCQNNIINNFSMQKVQDKLEIEKSRLIIYCMSLHLSVDINIDQKFEKLKC
jgi:hypothetical protein